MKQRIRSLLGLGVAIVSLVGLHSSLKAETASAVAYQDNTNTRFEPTSKTRPSQREVVDELIVTGERLDPMTLDLNELEAIYARKQIAATQFKQGNYAEAFPTLLSLAKQGFVDAQARVGFIYLHGLGDQPKSNLNALGWLGVATSGETRPEYRNYLNQLLNEVPTEHQTLVTETIADYTSRYSHKALGVQCHRGVHAFAFTCRFDAEMKKHQDHLNELYGSIEFQLPWTLL